MGLYRMEEEEEADGHSWYEDNNTAQGEGVKG
jgi:hypothetical protein